MSVGKRRYRRQLESMKNTINSLTDMKTNTHRSNFNTIPTDSQVAEPTYERILLGIDQHAADLRIVRQLDGAGTQPPQRVYPNGGDLERFIKKQLALAKKVYAVYEAGPCGFVLARQLISWGVQCLVIRPMKLDLLGKGVNTDKTDAAELVSRLDRYLAGNRKAFAIVRVPTPEQEQRRCISRQREQLRRQRQRLEAMGRSLMLCQGHRVLGPVVAPGELDEIISPVTGMAGGALDHFPHGALDGGRTTQGLDPLGGGASRPGPAPGMWSADPGQRHQ